MGIYLPNMDMPTEYPLWIVVSADGTVQYNYFNEWKTAEEKAVPVPPHGRMIDADALIDKVIAKYLKFERKGKLVFAAAEIKQDICDLISEAPTIIPAEEGE